MSETLSSQQSAQLHTLLTSIANQTASKQDASAPCQIYKTNVKPLLDQALPLIKLIPVYGEEVAEAITVLETLADAICT